MGTPFSNLVKVGSIGLNSPFFPITILSAPIVTVLANSIDWSLCREIIVDYYSKRGIPVVRVTPENFTRESGFIIILGGPDAYEGVGNISAQLLSLKDQEWLRKDPESYGKFEFVNVWVKRQHVVILAGHNRYLTRKAVEESFKEQRQAN